MKTPFSTEQFLEIFERYNLSVFPMQIIILLFGLLVLYGIKSKNPVYSKIIGAYLAFIWLWAGIVYHIGFFASLNNPAYVFGVLFIIQGILIIIETFRNKGILFTYRSHVKEITGIFLVMFGLILYPLISWLMKGSFPLIISAGLPCPTVITTFGFFALVSGKIKWYLFIIPVLWSLVGISAALNFGIYQDFMMLIAAITVILLTYFRKEKDVQTSAV